MAMFGENRSWSVYRHAGSGVLCRIYICVSEGSLPPEVGCGAAPKTPQGSVRGQPFPITNPNPTDSLAISTAKLQLHTKQPLRPASPGNLHRKWISVPWPMTAPLSVSDLIFSSAATDFNRVLGELKRSTLTLGNRLRSIQHDAAFVATVSAAYGLPLVANERCGSWYIAPERKAQSAYFKSTDGHIHQWSFSLRRLNLQVLETVVMHGGCVIVDSTRRGKAMPDALSKTVPIWTAVLNRYLFPHDTACHELRTPGISVTASEHSQIETRIDGFVEQLKSLNLDLTDLRGKLTKPLRPLWVTQESQLPLSPPTFSDCHPIILCTASRRVPGGEASEGGYIQGAGDDSESWAHGLTAPLFWQHKDELLATSEAEIPDLIKALIDRRADSGPAAATLIKPTTQLYIGTLEAADEAPAGFRAIVTCGAKSAMVDSSGGARHLHVACAPGKVGSRQLRNELAKVQSFVASVLRNNADADILVACSTGKDHSVGVALAILSTNHSHEAGDQAETQQNHGIYA
ncbi:tRNA A64-2'-O-ribosylphosphate transferase [Zalaria obscura]|uniref:tRNA A64-2'-O-ribosylphosphate transferase n=1 Tax=Zalaria obscura TaxID=2024903 RepID=A0ACC3SHC8_9PEZI